MAYQAPEGYKPYPDTNYYYTEREGTDVSGNPVRIVTYFDTETGLYSEQTYQVEAAANNQYEQHNYQNTNETVKKKSALPLIITLSSVAVVLIATVLVVWLTGAYNMIPIFSDDSNSTLSEVPSTVESTPDASSQTIADGDYVIEWVDENFEAAVREELFSGEDRLITYNDVKDFVELDLEDSNIERIDDIKHFTSISFLYLRNNFIEDLTPLENLDDLYFLELDNNMITNIDVLSNLTELTMLAAEDNYIEDLTPLSNLINLDMLFLDGNSIIDVSPLSNISGLADLSLEDNFISDISPLASLTNLRYLYLEDNQIFDWSPVSHVEYVYGAPESTPEPVQDVSVTPGVYAFYEDNFGDYVIYILVRPGHTMWLGATLGGSVYFTEISMHVEGHVATINGSVSDEMANMDITFPITLTYDENFTLVSPDIMWTIDAGETSDYIMNEDEMAEHYYYLYE